jgi:hypothetical protein
MVLQELKFSMSELVDPAKARKLGQMLGVQGLVVGTVSNVESTLDLDARMIDIQTDLSLPGASASIVKDEAVSKMASDCGAAVGPQIGQEPPQTPLATSAAVISVITEGIRFEVKACELSGTSVTCPVVMTNNSPEDQDIDFLPYRSRMIDRSGNEYKCLKYRFGSKQAAYYSPINWPSLQNTLVSRTPINLVMTFEKVSADATGIALLEIKCSVRYGGREFVAQLRNIPITR